MSVTWPTITHGSDTATTIDQSLDTRSVTLRSHFSDTSSPGSPVVGQHHHRDDAGGFDYVDVYGNFENGGDGWYRMGPVGKPRANINGSDGSPSARTTLYALNGWRAENVAAFPTPGANNHGMFGVLDSDGSFRWVDNTVAAAVLAACNIVPSSSYDTVEVDLHSLVLDATNPPTVATKGTTPTIRGLLFDAAIELAVVQAVVPSNWSADADLVLELDCVLNQGETNGDDIDWSADWVAATQGVDAVSKTSTAAVAVLHDIGTAIADGTLHRVPIVIDYDHASNPVAAGDLLAIEIHRTDLALVGGVIVVAARLKFTQKPRHARAT